MAKVALLIGVSEYGLGLNALPMAVKDIEAMQRVLNDPELGGFDMVKKLPNPDPQTMQYEIETFFSGTTKDDLVLLFFSGHGIKDERGRLFFATPITCKNNKGDLILSTAVPASFVHDIMNNCRCKRQAIILDCCFSGAFDPALQSKSDPSVDLLNELGTEGRVVLTSSSSTEYSFAEAEADLSIYTRYLVEGIETGAGDRNEDGFVSVLELHEYATSKVQETAPKMTPKIITLKDKGFDIVLSKARVADPKLIYRKAASMYASAGSIRPVGRAYLDTLKQQRGLTDEVAVEIEAEVLHPYRERLANLEKYQKALLAEAESEYPFSEETCDEIRRFQELLGLRDEDVLTIQQVVETQFFQNAEQQQKIEVDRQRQIEVQRQRQEQERIEHENKLLEYEQDFSSAIQAEYPLIQVPLNKLKIAQHQQELKDEDIIWIEQPLHDHAKAIYQEKMKQYEKEFNHLIQDRSSLNSYSVQDRLRQVQRTLGLTDSEVAKVEARVTSQYSASPSANEDLGLPEIQTQGKSSHQSLPLQNDNSQLFKLEKQSIIRFMVSLGAVLVTGVLLLRLPNLLTSPESPSPTVDKETNPISTPLATVTFPSATSPKTIVSSPSASQSTLPSPATNSSTISTPEAEKLVKSWQTAKAEAMSEQYNPASLQTVLLEPALSDFKSRVAQNKAAQGYWKYTLDQLEIQSIDSLGKGRSVIKAKVKETAQYFEGGKLVKAQSYTDTYPVKYTVVQIGQRWYIQDIQVQ